MYHIILDMDGVLADSWDDVIDGLLLHDWHGTTREEVLRSHEIYTRRKPVHARNSGMSPEIHAKINTGLDILATHLLKVSPPLFDDFVRELHQLEAQMAVVSAGQERYVRKMAKRSGLPFTHVLSFDQDPSKEAKIERICKDWNVSVSEVIYVTDTLADVYELENFMPREHIIGCAWGYCGYAVLREELPKEQILKNPKDIHDVISKMKIQKSNNK